MKNDAATIKPTLLSSPQLRGIEKEQRAQGQESVTVSGSLNGTIGLVVNFTDFSIDVAGIIATLDNQHPKRVDASLSYGDVAAVLRATNALRKVAGIWGETVYA